MAGARRIDSHQHFWTLARGDYGWLDESLAPLYRDFGPADLKPLLEAADIDATVVVQAAPTVAETRFLLDVAARTEFVAGVVGWIDMERDAAVEQLAELATDPHFRGIRPMIQDIPDPEWLLRPDLTEPLRELARRDLCLDALVHPLHLENLLALLRRHPDLRVVIDHGAKPDIAAGAFEPWATHMAALARETAACCKLSGLVTEASRDWTLEDLKPFAAHLIECFGPARLMWGSDWPVVELAGGHGAWWQASEALVAELAPAQRAEILGGTAASFYGI